MSGEINATNVLLKKGTGSPSTVDGQMELTATWGGTPIDISNKSYFDNVTYLDEEVSSQQLVISGTLTYNNGATYKEMLTEQVDCTQDDYTFEFPDGRKYEGKFVPSGISFGLPQGDKVTTPFTLSSSGPVLPVEPS